MGDKVAIVGAGGGYRGVAEVGFLEEIIPFLVEMKIKPQDLFLFGVSVSALNFSALAVAKTIEELPERLNELAIKWKLIQSQGPKAIFDIKLRKAWNSQSLLSSEPLFNLLSDFNAEAAVNSPITFGCFVRNDDTKKYEVLTNHDPYFKKHKLEFTKAPVASASLSPYFPRVRIGRYNYCDGGYITLAPSVKAGCKIIFVLFPYPEKQHINPLVSSFIQKHFSLILNLISDAAAVLRDKDKDALLFAYQENWRNVLAMNSTAKKAAIIKILEEEPSGAYYLFGELAAEVLEKLKSSSNRYSDSPASAAHVSNLLKSLIKIVPIYAEPPISLTINSFKPRDFDLVIQSGRNAARRECEKLKLLL